MNNEIIKIVNEKSKRIKLTGVILCIIILPGLLFNSNTFLYVIKICALLFSLWLIRFGSNRLDDPKMHPGIERFNADPDFMNLLDKELMNKSEMKKLNNNITLTPSFMLYKSFYRFIPYSAQEAVWVYIKQIKNYLYFIPTGSSWSVILHLSNGDNFEIEKTKKNAEELLYKIISWAPFIISGYDKIMNWNDIFNVVEKRKADYFENPKKFLNENYSIDMQEEVV